MFFQEDTDAEGSAAAFHKTRTIRQAMPSGAGAIVIVVAGGISVSAIFNLFRDLFSTPEWESHDNQYNC